MVRQLLRFALSYSAFFGLIGSVHVHGADIPLIPFGSTWKYLDNGTDQGTAWRAPAFTDAAWPVGPAQLGYGDADEATVVSFGPNAAAKYVTTYFRKTITLADPSAFAGYAMRILRDDGVIVYVNGTEVLRQNMAQGTMGHTALAYQAVSNTEEGQLLQLLLSPSQFTAGANTIAVEMHQNAANSSDLSFDLELLGLDATPELHRGPYLHIATPSSITVCWTSNIPTDGRVRYGTAPNALNMSVVRTGNTLQHEVTLTGLQPDTRYYYAIGSSAHDLTSGAADTFFDTHPPQGHESAQRIWVIGDAGTGFVAQKNVRDSYINFINSSRKADAWLMLGDNAYGHGRESEYQIGLFHDMYEPILRNTTMWPAPGNHDYGSGANATTNTGPYYDLFALPRNGQAGGVPSNTEAYYSFDLGNIHFIALDSYGVSRATTGAMATWLQADLQYAEANAKWIIAYWHHPPYTKGSHNSDDVNDSGGLMRDMRQNIVPILEAHGVDLVLTGHSHSYERSFLIDGHYDVSTTFNAATMGRNMTSGRSGAPGAYTKPSAPTAHAGAVYTVCGVSGKRDPQGALNHPVMYLSTYAHHGSMILDIDGDSMHVQFINEAGAVVDHFDMVKPPTSVVVPVKVMLQGPFLDGTGTMNDALRATPNFPLAQPHNGIFPMVGSGGETVAPSVLQQSGATAIVDWVLLELRTKDQPATILATRSALLRRDGRVVEVDGSSPVSFTVPVGEYHVAVRHRNHLGVMTAQPIRLNRTTPLVDFSLPSTPTWGTDARCNVNGTMVLWCGDVHRDGTVIYTGGTNDRDRILEAIGGSVPTQTVDGYRSTDVDLDGVTKYTGNGNDRDRILFTIGGVVATNVRTEQVP